MNAAEMETLSKAIHATAEVLGHEIKPNAALVMVDDLSGYSLVNVLTALKRCRQELTGRLTLAGILDRMQAADGRPTANEAWAIALRAMDEHETVVMNDDISAAMTLAKDIFRAGDEIGARMAFRDSYDRIIREAREKGAPVKWWPSLGYDVDKRAPTIEQAVAAGLLPASRLDALPAPSNGIAGLIEHAGDGVSKEVRQQRLAEIRALLGPPKPKPISDEEFRRRKAQAIADAEREIKRRAEQQATNITEVE